jgi:hypothetical protein
VQSYVDCTGAGGTWVLDAATLLPTGTTSLPVNLPAEIAELEPPVASLCGVTDDVRTRTVWGRALDVTTGRDLVRWVSLGANRDQPRLLSGGAVCAPEPTPLRFFRLEPSP